jgi:sugar/nucleoside kinase (ribokinase family)
MPSAQQHQQQQQHQQSKEERTPPRIILVVGACALDRILHLDSYPIQDSKMRCSQTFEYGGGNAANTASAMARLVDAKFLLQGGGHNRIGDGGGIGGTCSHSDDNNDGDNDGDGNEDNVGPITIKLLSKIGNDLVQKQICCELKQCGVDLSSPLFQIGPPETSSTRTTPIATVLVTTIEPHSRTCIYDPGTCGELTAADVNHLLQQQESMVGEDFDDIFDNVIHFHSDSRHTEAAALLAREAKRRGIPVSVDVERDRHSKAFDELIDSASIIFTNENKMSCTLERRLVIPVDAGGGGGETILMERRGRGKQDEDLMHVNQKGDLADVAALCYALEAMSMNKASADADASRRVKELVVTL